jgi:hypothetical protein
MANSEIMFLVWMWDAINKYVVNYNNGLWTKYSVNHSVVLKQILMN